MNQPSTAAKRQRSRPTPAESSYCHQSGSPPGAATRGLTVRLAIDESVEGDRCPCAPGCRICTPEASPRSQLSALDAQLADRDTYLKPAENLEGFLARPRTSAQAASTEERLRVLRLRAKDVLISPEKITSGTASPIRDTNSASDHHIAERDTKGDHRPGYPLC